MQIERIAGCQGLESNCLMDTGIPLSDENISELDGSKWFHNAVNVNTAESSILKWLSL